MIHAFVSFALVKKLYNAKYLEINMLEISLSYHEFLSPSSTANLPFEFQFPSRLTFAISVGYDIISK